MSKKIEKQCKYSHEIKIRLFLCSGLGQQHCDRLETRKCIRKTDHKTRIILSNFIWAGWRASTNKDKCNLKFYLFPRIEGELMVDIP